MALYGVWSGTAFSRGEHYDKALERLYRTVTEEEWKILGKCMRLSLFAPDAKLQRALVKRSRVNTNTSVDLLNDLYEIGAFGWEGYADRQTSMISSASFRRCVSYCVVLVAVLVTGLLQAFIFRL
jgi:hypothetical protein